MAYFFIFGAICIAVVAVFVLLSVASNETEGEIYE
jgi:hypothetical protein